MSDPREWMRNYVRYSSLFLQLIITIVGGVFLGYKVDEWLQTKPIFLLIFTVVFSAMAFYLAVRELLRKN
ncbi:MAG: AtpZ/AtpI family protein [Bacteroidales bacterium]|nr:AtpZ/AtpI family protein [Bacteroidales bacterium]HOK98326.1 AtpZ/AtpI family protein [Bacteroidales bacterium]HPO65193.1 AtpZ/AtpI family protein [Bacteroidales bacterium]